MEGYTLHLEVVGLGYIKQVIAFRHFKLMPNAILVDESNAKSAQACFSKFFLLPFEETYSSPGLGGSICPCDITELVENLRRDFSSPFM